LIQITAKLHRIRVFTIHEVRLRTLILSQCGFTQNKMTETGKVLQAGPKPRVVFQIIFQLVTATTMCAHQSMQAKIGQVGLDWVMFSFASYARLDCALRFVPCRR
jgi:hypothetical protein